MSAPDEPPDQAADRLAEAKRWIAIARDDIDVARAAIQLARPRAGIAAYHLQQAAEKLFKAMLVLAGQAFRRTHDLDDLADQLASLHPQWQDRLNALRHLTVWGVAYRYPGLEDEPEPEPSIAEIEQTAVAIGALIVDVEARESHG